MRQNPTDAERKLWQRLRQLPQTHFRRQATIGPYYADFASHNLRLVIEVDGGQHLESKADAARTNYLQSQGYRVLRFWNNDVLANIEGVIESIASAAQFAPPTPNPSPPQVRGEGNAY